MCVFHHALKDVLLYLIVNTLQLSEHTHIPGWQKDCGMRGNINRFVCILDLTSGDTCYTVDEETGQKTAAATGAAAADSGTA